MKEERDVIKEAPTKEESKIQKYIRIALVGICIAFLLLLFIMGHIRKNG